MTESEDEDKNGKRPCIAEGIHRVNKAGTNKKRSVKTDGKWAHLETGQQKKIQDTSDDAITRSMGEEATQQLEARWEMRRETGRGRPIRREGRRSKIRVGRKDPHQEGVGNLADRKEDTETTKYSAPEYYQYYTRGDL